MAGRTAHPRFLDWPAARGVALVSLVLAGFGCSESPSNTGGTAPSGSASAATAPSAAASSAVGQVGIPVSPEKVSKVVNAGGLAPYDGKTGTIVGTVTLEGDPPKDADFIFPEECGGAADTYGKVFRVGEENRLADVMVGVTEYDAYVPSTSEAVKVTIQGCAFSQRTLAVTYGQRIEVSNLDGGIGYMPYLDGAPFRAVMVALPGGDPIKLYPQEPGRMLLRDQMKRPFMIANVFVVPFATHAVTGLDGKFRIEGVPVGKAKVSALLPPIRKGADEVVDVKEGDNEVHFTIAYDVENDVVEKPPEPVFGDRAVPKGMQGPK